MQQRGGVKCRQEWEGKGTEGEGKEGVWGGQGKGGGG